jgi:endonuclease YncB( thermonuclease family)
MTSRFKRFLMASGCHAGFRLDSPWQFTLCLHSVLKERISVAKCNPARFLTVSEEATPHHHPHSRKRSLAKRARSFFAAPTLALASPSHADTITGRVSVVDGETLQIASCLSGIDAPESDQLCRGDDSPQYRCGAKAANELARFIAGRPVSCKGVDN